jgi:hypothetical protein
MMHYESANSLLALLALLTVVLTLFRQRLRHALA